MRAGAQTLVDALGVATGDIVSLVGAGGKTTAMLRLAAEIAQSGGRVVTTTTTRLATSETARAPVHVSGIAGLPAALAACRHVMLTGTVDAATDKVDGIAPDVLCGLHLLHTVLLIEADGSRRLPFKAPAEHEPVIPACSTLVVPVIGIDALGSPVDSRHVHRPERVLRIFFGTTVTTEMIVTVMAHAEGGCKNIPLGARVVLIINKVDDDKRRELASDLALRALRTGRFSAVALAALSSAGQPILEVLRR